MKLTKKALNDFIQWSNTRYNDYCGYGTKAENVAIVYNSLLAGHYIGYNNKPEEGRTTFKIQCALSVGENGRGRYWRTKANLLDWEYKIDCINKTVKGVNSKRMIQFDQQSIAVKPAQ